ncbi:MAG: hypothetical protein JSW61_10655 [Candidatus Thorarchaeota archaeon]|nr:MAG: hypothetical protein JSW61_10655 [Candidatus Thorarchaeota archaeon]
MDPTIWAIIGLSIGALAFLNYLLNHAPGSDPEDFQLGPAELGVSCDCFLIPMVLGGIAVLGLSISSGAFDSREELYIVGIVAFSIITLAGYIGRRRRYREWRELRRIFERAVPTSTIHRPVDNPVDIQYEFDDEEEDY